MNPIYRYFYEANYKAGDCDAHKNLTYAFEEELRSFLDGQLARYVKTWSQHHGGGSDAPSDLRDIQEAQGKALRKVIGA